MDAHGLPTIGYTNDRTGSYTQDNVGYVKLASCQGRTNPMLGRGLILRTANPY